MLFQPLMSRCPETQAMVFSTPPEVVAEQARQAARDAESSALKALLGQVIAVLPDAYRAQLDPDLVAQVTATPDAPVT